MTTRAGVYGRNSKGEAKSIEDQLKLGRGAVDEEGWTLAGEYSDDSSASLYRQKERKNWARLLGDLAAGSMDVLVLWKPARGSRDEIDWFPLLRLCADRGVRIHVVAERRTYDPREDRDWKFLADEGVNSAYYSRQLSKDVRRGVRQAAIGGSPHGRVAFGYDGCYDPETKRPLRQPNAHVPIVREIFERLAALTPVSALMKDFRQRDLPSPSGGPWQRNTIRTIATNISYIGKRLYEGQVYDAQWPAIVDDATFWRVQEILSRPERKTTRPGSAKYLLTYIATAPCGSRVRRNAGGHGYPGRYVCAEDGCVSIVQVEADEVVRQILLARLDRPDARELLAMPGGSAEAAAEADRYRVQLEEARRSFERPDGISAEALARKERALLPLIEEADRRSRPVGAAGGALAKLLDAEDRDAEWTRLEIAARREVVRAVAYVVLGLPTRRLGKFADPADRLLEAWARLTAASTWVGDGSAWS